MPTIPNNTKCAQLGCKNTRSKINSYCLEHGGLNDIDTQERKEFKSMYQTAQWRSLRTRQLSIQPLCQCCLTKGKVTQAKHIDHLFAWNKIGKQAFHENIFQSLCENCHSLKTGLEQKGVYRHYSNTVIDYALADYKRVVSKGY